MWQAPTERMVGPAPSGLKQQQLTQAKGLAFFDQPGEGEPLTGCLGFRFRQQVVVPIERGAQDPMRSGFCSSDSIGCRARLRTAGR